MAFHFQSPNKAKWETKISIRKYSFVKLYDGLILPFQESIYLLLVANLVGAMLKYNTNYISINNKNGKILLD